MCACFSGQNEEGFRCLCALCLEDWVSLGLAKWRGLFSL